MQAKNPENLLDDVIKRKLAKADTNTLGATIHSRFVVAMQMTHTGEARLPFIASRPYCDADTGSVYGVVFYRLS